MALRNIVTEGDEVLRKKCRPVSEVNDRIRTLIDDMSETMYDASGVGLAAPQIGVLRRIFVVDDGSGSGLIELVNPEIVEKSGSQIDDEACLSIPGYCGEVERPDYVKMKGLDRNGNEIEVEGRDFLARALCHEYDHLDGILYSDIATDFRRV